MRLLHTSDWHLGRALHGESLLEPQAVFLDWLLAQAISQQADAVVVAGDVYDRAVPPLDAVRLLDRALTAFAGAGIPMLITSGNHDSAVRLGFGSGLSEAAGIHLRTSPADLARPLVLTDERGRAGPLRHSLPASGRGDDRAGRGALARVGAGGGVGADPRGRGGAWDRARGDRGSRLRDRWGGLCSKQQRLGAGHPGRRGGARPRLGVRPGLLRGPGAPARSAGCVGTWPARAARCATAARRWRSRSRRRTTASRCPWWTSEPTGRRWSPRWPPRCRGRCARSAAGWTSCWPGPTATA